MGHLWVFRSYLSLPIAVLHTEAKLIYVFSLFLFCFVMSMRRLLEDVMSSEMLSAIQWLYVALFVNVITCMASFGMNNSAGVFGQSCAAPEVVSHSLHSVT